MTNDFKKDLVKVLILAALVVVALVFLSVWDQKTGILENFAKSLL